MVNIQQNQNHLHSTDLFQKWSGNIMTIQEMFKLGMKRDIPELIPSAESGIILNLGAGKQIIDGAANLDYPDWDAEKDPIPYMDETVDQIHAYHFLEHISDVPRMLKECQRVLVPGGHMNIVVPYYNSQLQSTDLYHKNVFCEETWCNLFNTPYYDKGRDGWRFKIGVNVIIGIVERNICLMTQLIKE